jgi:hypothetical protein
MSQEIDGTTLVLTASDVRSDDTCARNLRISARIEGHASPRAAIHTGPDISLNSECDSYDTKELPTPVIKRPNVTNMVEVPSSAGVPASGSPEAAA